MMNNEKVKVFLKKYIEAIPSFFYYIAWLFGMISFLILIYLSLIQNDISKYISALAILLSAFLAALSVVRSIRHSKITESKNILARQKTNLTFLDFILLDIYRQICFINSESKHILVRHKKLHKTTNDTTAVFKNNIDNTSSIRARILELEKEKADILNNANSYVVHTLKDRNQLLAKRRIQIEDKEILYSLDGGQRICLFEISGLMLSLEHAFSHINNSNHGIIVLDGYINSTEKLFENMQYWIKLLKDDIQKQFPDLRILSIDEFNERKTADSKNDE